MINEQRIPLSLLSFNAYCVCSKLALSVALSVVTVII